MERRPAAFIAALLLATAAAAPPARAATLTLINLDGPGEGFNDPTPATPVGGNPGTTLGQQRLNVFNTACLIWGQIVPSNITIHIDARFDALTPCDATSGVLGSAGAINVASDFFGALVPNTWYAIALANKLTEDDLAVGTSDINARFNSSVDNDVCLGPTGWYYGYDHDEGTDIDLLAVVLHEIGHGLGFQTFTSLAIGSFLNNRPDIYARNLFDRTLGLRWDQMNNNQRKNSALNTGNLVWNGSYAQGAAHQFLGPSAVVRIDSPPAIAGEKDFGTAEFGAAPADPPLQGEIVLADDGVVPTTDACEPIVNGAQIAGKIALIDRGTCTFVAKAQAAQAAGAIAVIIGNNVAGPPPGMSGVDPTITIPVVSITLDDTDAIKAELGSGAVTATIGIDPAHLAGTDLEGRPRMYAPNPLEQGSSVSHWDVTATPNLLMEPFIYSDLAGVDLTPFLFADIGWWGGPSAVAQGPAPAVAARGFSTPNPFSRATSIRFQLARGGKTEVDVFAVGGGLVRRMPVSWRPAGPQSVDWDGTDARGRRIPAGVYFWRVRSADQLLTGRMVRVE